MTDVYTIHLVCARCGHAWHAASWWTDDRTVAAAVAKATHCPACAARPPMQLVGLQATLPLSLGDADGVG